MPIQPLPFCRITGVPPGREASSRFPSASVNGPRGSVARPTDTEYPVAGPAQQLADEANR